MRLSRYWLAVIGLAILVPATIAVIDASFGTDPEEIFCTAEGLIGPNGEMHGRSTSQGCQFVDDEGNLVTQTIDRKPLCYGGHKNMGIVPCDQPGAVRPG